jgi:hypothetical protein
MKTYKIEVKERDIKRGKVMEPCLCPVALALKRKFKKHVTVGYIFTSVLGLTSGTELPERAKTFIAKFDNGKPVKPFSFTIKL